MLRIECESCHAPYQVDERRVPPQGLKMRCPKCGHTFTVQAGGAQAAAAPAPAAATAAKPAPLAPAKAMKMTMVGLGEGVNVDLPAKPASLPKSPPIPPKPAAPIAAPTVASPAVPPAPGSKPSVQDDLPAARPVPPRPGAAPPRPAPPRPGVTLGAKPPLPAFKPAAPPAPAPAPAVAEAAPAFELDLPAPREKHPSLPAALGSSADLDLPAPREASDLPATRAAPKPVPHAPRPPAAPPAPPPAPVAAPAPKAEAAFGEIDLPEVAASFPAAPAKPAAPRPKAPEPKAPEPKAPAPAPAASKSAGSQELTFDLDLPNPKAAPAAPAPKDDLELDLGPPAADLPAPLAGLPELAAPLPTKKDEPAFGEIDLPSLDGQLPQVQSTLPQVAATLPTIADVLPTVGQQLPETVDDQRLAPSHKETLDFGEVDLGPLGAAPLDLPPPPQMPPAKAAQPATQSMSPFAELDLDAADMHSLPPSQPPIPDEVDLEPPPAPAAPAVEKSALKYGEVDLGAAAAAPLASIQTEEPLRPPPPIGGGGGDELSLPEAPADKPSKDAGAQGGVELSLPIQTGRKHLEHEEETPSRAPRVIMLLALLLLLGGASLQFTKHGAFGYLTISDAVHAKDYQKFAETQSAAARVRTNKDTFPEVRGSVDDLLAAHWRMPRATGLSAYAAFAEFAYEARFGADADRNAKAKLILADVLALPETRYLNAALAAQDAAGGNVDKARKSLDAASKRDAGDPIQRDIALVRGEVELTGHDPKAAKTAFETALKLGATAPAHYGLARVAMIARDWTTVAAECDATLAASPHHPGALLLRAMQRYEAKGDDTNALADLAEVTEGPAKPLASNGEIAQALANRGRIFLQSGRAGDARGAFENALKLDSRNVDALVGQGTVFYQESRYTEALTRFDTALGTRPDDELAISYDALAKVKLERLKEAKDQLVAGRTKFPKSMRLTFALAQAEAALGNAGDAEKYLRQAIDFASMKDPESVQPYIALATLVARKSDKDAQTVIDEAKSKLPDEAPVSVAFGEYDAAQGKYDEAVAQFRHALELSPSSLSTHFKLGVTYRHMRKPDLAAQEFDQVLAIDKDYPGLALERGLLFEESGEVERALEQFKNALARAPDDLDLQLRVGAAYVAVGRPEDALPMLRKVLEKRGSSGEANHYLGRAIFAKDGATAEAMRFLKHAVELDPNRPEYHLYVGWAANESNPAQLGLAQDEIQKALDLDKLLADAYWQRGVLERKRLAVEDALHDLRRALELRPSRIDAYATMAECFEDKNDPQSALGAWQKAVSGNPRNLYWNYRYGKLLLDRGSATEAVPHLTQAVEDAMKLDVKPPWLAPAEFAAGEALNRVGKRAESITMYRRFLEIASMNDPDRRDALKALQNMGETYRPGR